MDLPDFAPLEPGTYFIDPDGDPYTPVRVVYEIPVEGWSQWIGALRSSEETEGQVGVSIITATNLVRDGCRDHRPADPPVGSSIDDLAATLAVTLPPSRSRSVAIRAPATPKSSGSSTSKAVALSGQTRGSPATDVAEMRAILDSIRIEL